jgi:hypothetical protein
MIDRSAFVSQMIGWLNRRFGESLGVEFRGDTPLFDGGRINSIRILELIAWTERAIGRPIADASIRMDNFRSVQRIADVFIPAGEHVGL